MNENLKPVKELTPFTRMIMTIGTLPSSFYASMSYYESMVWLYEYLKNEVIPTVNNNAEAVEELQEKFIELKEWTETYTEETIPVEIRNQLDEMAEDGTLTSLIIQYGKSIKVYNNVQEMKDDDSLFNGAKVETYGFHQIGDGGNATYLIRTKTTSDTINEMNILSLNDNNLVAEIIISKDINPEMFGAYGDNTHDDSDALEYMFNRNENVKLFNKKTYLSSKTINLNTRKTIDFGLSTIRFTNEDVGLYISMVDVDYSHERFAPVIENLILDGLNNSKVMYIDYAYKSIIQNVYVNNFLNIGIEKYRGYELIMNNIYLWASNQNTTSIGLLISGNDCEFGHIFGINCHTGIKLIGGGNHIGQAHFWIFDDTSGEGMLDINALYENSSMVEIAGNDRYFLDYCYFDSYQYAINYNGYGQVYINSALMYCPDLSSSISSYNTLPIKLIYATGDKMTYLWRIVINNLSYVVGSGTVDAKVIPDNYHSKPLRFGKKIIPYDVDNIPKDYISLFTLQNCTNVSLQATPISDGKLRLHGVVKKDDSANNFIIPYPDTGYAPEFTNEAVPCVTSASQYGTNPSLYMINIGTNNVAGMGTPVANNYYFIDVIINVNYL